MSKAWTVRQARGHRDLSAIHRRNRRVARPIGCFLLTGIVGLIMVSSTQADDFGLGMFSSERAEHRIWRPYTDLSFRGGDNREMGEADLFLPLVQDNDQLLFADLRGKFFDDDSSEGNWGLAYRQIRPSKWILGGYAFYDLRDSTFNNTWHQGTFGAELMNVDWDFRLNGYLAEGGAQATGTPTASLVSGTIVVQNSIERAYSGFDAEIGKLLWASRGDYDAEVRGYVGGFHFDDDAPGFPDISGPRARLEMRLYDLNLLGRDSRLTFGYQYQYDDVRDSQHTALVTLRIPFGRGGGRSGRRMTPLERRMVEPIFRDVDVVTQGGTTTETARMNGVDIGSATRVYDGGNLGAAVTTGGANSVVIANGNLDTTEQITLNQNQAVLGGGSSLQVTTASGLTATYTAPGTQPTISGEVDDTNNTADRVFVLAENSTLSGVNIAAGEVGVYGEDVTGFTVVNNTINGMTDDDIPADAPIAGHGIHLHGSVSGTVTDNTLGNNQGSGLHLTGNTITGGTIADNTITSDGTDGVHGIYLEEFAGGTISGNVVKGYKLDLSGFGVTDDAYVNIKKMTGGTISNNTIGTIADPNEITNDDGNVFAMRIGEMTGGTITNNKVNGNKVTVTHMGDVAALYVGTMSDGTVSNNTVNGNTVNSANGGIAAMFVNDMQGGNVINNTVDGNKATGDLVGAFAARKMSGGTVSGNTVDGNEANGSVGGAGIGVLGTFDGGTISSNTVSNNTNTSGNAPSGFYIGVFDTGATLQDNTATDNAGAGYEVGANTGGTATNNTGSGNTGGQNTYP